MEDAVRAVELSKTYGTGPATVKALDHVSLTIPRGTVAALLGPSGSGKSTLIKALGFVSPADTGEVYFGGRLVVKDGVPLADLAALRRRHLGFVFQKANLTSFLTARENVEIACEFGGKSDGRKRARIGGKRQGWQKYFSLNQHSTGHFSCHMLRIGCRPSIACKHDFSATHNGIGHQTCSINQNLRMGFIKMLFRL